MSTRIYTGDAVDGVSIGLGPNDPICHYNSGPVPQRSNPLDGPAGIFNGGQVVTYQQSLTVASIAANTAAEQSITVGTTAGNGPLTTDFLAAINKPTTNAGMGIHGGRISAANTIQLVLSNATNAAVTPTATQTYNVTLLRNLPVQSQTLTPASIPGSGVAGVGTTMEQIFNLTPVTAVATAVVNTAGGVSGAIVTTAGSNYTTAPTVVFTDPAGIGKGASGLALVSSTGTILSIQITNAGSGYTAATPPTIMFLGGNAISTGMAVMVTKPTTTAGVAIGGARVVGSNQIAITYVNLTSAAVTPAAEAYTVVGLNTMPPVNHITSYGAVATGLSSVASQTSSEQGITVNGLLATDICVGVQKPTLSTGLLNGTGRISAANTLQIQFINATGAAVTPSATEIYGVTVLNQQPIIPFSVLNVNLTPTSVAAQTTAEQQFTVTPLAFINSSPCTVVINKPSWQAGLAIAGARVSAANTLQITYENVTAAAITPVAEVYTIGVFNAVGPLTGVPGSWVALGARTGCGQTINLTNELQQALGEAGVGIIRGA